MGKSLIQVANQSTQVIAENSIIDLGSVIRRYGCGCRLSGNAILIKGAGYYKIDGAVTIEPAAEGTVTVAAYADGVQIPGMIASGNAAAASPVTLSFPPGTERIVDCDGSENITFMLLAGAGNITNVSVRIEKS
jgi:hypothetical protein